MVRSKSLENHQKDVEKIVINKGGKIIKSEWREIGGRRERVPYFYIECDNNEEKHRWWVYKGNLIPSRTNPMSKWCPQCPKGKILKEHQKEIERIVKANKGKIIGVEWRLRDEKSQKKEPYFYIECDKKHKWWFINTH